MPALLQTWSREAQAFVALRDAWAAGVEPQFAWAWRFERVPPTHPLAACVDGYLVWERHFRAPIAAAAPECCASEEDAACAPRDASLDEWEYHILPSTAYGSPELRLRVSRYDGAPRSPAEIRRVFAGDAVLSWEPHPVTGELFCLVHGCLDGDAGDDASFSGHADRVFGLRYLASTADVLVSGGWDNTLRVWDARVADGRSVSTLRGPQVCGDAVDVEPEGTGLDGSGGGDMNNRVLVASWRDRDAVQVWDLR